MPMTPSDFNQRSVDSLQKIYAVIVALAVSLSIQRLVINPADNSFLLSTKTLESLPAFLSLVAILVPFYHGMNRHLDKCYLENEENKVIRGALLFDFIVFFFEASLLFIIAASISSGLQSYVFIGILLFIDMVWGIISHWIHYKKKKPGVIIWSFINFCTLVIAPFVYLIDAYTDNSKSWLLFALAVTRTVADYKFCWEFYFPNTENDKG